MREVRLGDDIDDYCVRCKRIMNHAVVSVMNGEAAKVRCRTCSYEHNYRGNKGSKQMTKEQAFNKLLAQAKEQLGGKK